MVISEEQVKKLKEIEVDILKQFIKVCDLLNLKYYIIAGTLIGAIRHKGFIPWDDDIDIAMPRDDFNTFILKGQEYLPQNLFIQTYKTDGEFLLNIAKIRDSDTTFIEKTSKRLNINKGIFIDIFPLDNFINTPTFRIKAQKKIKVLKIAIGRKFYREKSSFKLKLKQFISRFIFPSSKKAMDCFEKYVTNIPKSEYCNNYSSNYGFKEACPWQWFDNGVDVTFEGLTVKAPKNYDLYLKQIYGDYLKLPPKEKQVSCHDTDIIDVNNSYLIYSASKE